MNKERRAEIASLVKQIEAIANDYALIREQIETLRDEEQEYYDNMPESFQGGEKGSAAESAIAALSSAFDEMPENLDEIIGYLEQAAE